MDIVVLGIDLGKNSCSLAGLDASGRVVAASDPAEFMGELRQRSWAMDRGDGSVLRWASPGPRVYRPRA
jgi:hypothetical protein